MVFALDFKRESLQTTKRPLIPFIFASAARKFLQLDQFSTFGRQFSIHSFIVIYFSYIFSMIKKVCDDQLTRQIKKAVREHVRQTFGEFVAHARIVVTVTRRREKYSAHIIVHGFVMADAPTHMAGWFASFEEYLKTQYASQQAGRRWIDPKSLAAGLCTDDVVYTPNRCLRLPWNSKFGYSEPLVPGPDERHKPDPCREDCERNSRPHDEYYAAVFFLLRFKKKFRFFLFFLNFCFF